MVVVVVLERGRPFGLGLEALSVCLLGYSREVVRVPSGDDFTDFLHEQAFAGELTDRVQQQEALVADRLDETRVDQELDYVERGVADALGCVQREGPCEDPAAGEHLLRARIEEIVAPFDRRAERALPLGRVARPRRQQRQRAIEAPQQAIAAQQARACCRQLDGERQAIETGADGIDGLGRRIGSACLFGAGYEELGRAGCLEGLEPVLVLAGPAQRRPARDQQAKTIREREQLVYFRRRAQHVLEVVEEQE